MESGEGRTNELLFSKRSSKSEEIEQGTSETYNVHKHFYAPVSKAGVAADLFFRLFEHDTEISLLDTVVDQPYVVRTNVGSGQSHIMEATMYGNRVAPGGSQKMFVDLADKDREQNVRLEFTLARMHETSFRRSVPSSTPEEMEDAARAAENAARAFEEATKLIDQLHLDSLK